MKGALFLFVLFAEGHVFHMLLDPVKIVCPQVIMCRAGANMMSSDWGLEASLEIQCHKQGEYGKGYLE